MRRRDELREIAAGVLLAAIMGEGQVSAQVALSLVLIAAGILFARSLRSRW